LIFKALIAKKNNGSETNKRPPISIMTARIRDMINIKFLAPLATPWLLVFANQLRIK